MYKVGDKVFYNNDAYTIQQLFNNGDCVIQQKYSTIGVVVNISKLSPVDSVPRLRHVIKYIVVDTLNADRPITVYDKEKDAIEKCETLNKLSINIGDIFKHSDGTAVEVVNSTLEETEVMLEIAGSVYYSKYDNQQFLKEFTK